MNSIIKLRYAGKVGNGFKVLSRQVTVQVLLICAAAMPGMLAAQEAGSRAKQDTLVPYPLSEIVITADRYSSTRFYTPEAIDRIESSTMQQDQLRTAPEALIRMPGVFVQKTSHGGGSPFVRGMTGNQTLLLVDGIRLSNATQRYGPNQYFNTIDVFSLDRIEVLRGSGSVQYGSDAIGGTIHAMCRDAVLTDKPSWRTSLLARMMTQGMEQSLHGDLEYGSRKAAFRGGITWRDFGDLVGGDTTGRQIPTGYDELDYDVRGKIMPGPKTTLTFAFQQIHQRNVPVYHKVALENYAVNKMGLQDRKLAWLRMNHKLDKGIWKDLTLAVSWQHTEEERDMRKNGSDILRYENDRVRSAGFSAEAFTARGDFWSANSGLEVYTDRVKSMRTDADLSNGTSAAKRGLYPDGSEMSSLAAFSIHRFSFPRWNISAGARWNTYIINVSDRSTGTTMLTPSALVGNLSCLRKISPASNVFASLNTGFRAPNIDDLGTLGIVDFRYEQPNFELKPEHSIQVQLGYKYQGRKFSGEAYLYHNELYDLIVRNRAGSDSIEGYPVYRKENAERARIQGVEASWSLVPARSWLLSGSITYTHGLNITNDEPVRRIPPVFGMLALEYRHKKGRIGAECLAAGKQTRLAQGDKDDNRIPEGGTPGWTVLNILGSYQFGSFTVDLCLNNILNRDYRYHGSGVNGIGRSAMVTMRFELKKVYLKSNKTT